MANNLFFTSSSSFYSFLRKASNDTSQVALGTLISSMSFSDFSTFVDNILKTIETTDVLYDDEYLRVIYDSFTILYIYYA